MDGGRKEAGGRTERRREDSGGMNEEGHLFLHIPNTARRSRTRHMHERHVTPACNTEDGRKTK